MNPIIELIIDGHLIGTTSNYRTVKEAKVYLLETYCGFFDDKRRFKARKAK